MTPEDSKVIKSWSAKEMKKEENIKMYCACFLRAYEN